MYSAPLSLRVKEKGGEVDRLVVSPFSPEDIDVQLAHHLIGGRFDLLLPFVSGMLLAEISLPLPDVRKAGERDLGDQLARQQRRLGDMAGIRRQRNIAVP